MTTELSGHPENVSTPVPDQARVMKAAATPKESMVYHRPFYLDRDDDFWRRVDDCIQQEKLREFEKEEGF